MRIVNARRISQAFFLLLFLWFCITATFGADWNELRGWPINWFLHLDPLASLATVLSTHSLWAPLLWSLVTVVLTIVLGRFFCSWLCPFGTMHHFVGWLGQRGRPVKERIARNRYRPAQKIKYYVLLAFLVAAFWPWGRGTLLTGWLDPIPLVTRSVNLALLPAAEALGVSAAAATRLYEGAWILFVIVLAALALNLLIPRFYCRFVCPLGALFGLVSRFAWWRIGKREAACINCGLCEKACEGACHPASQMRPAECVLCFNCREDCTHDLVGYHTFRSRAGEVAGPDLSRRGVVVSLAGGVLATTALRAGAVTGVNYSARMVRPPGSLPEPEFLARCIKCGQCIRVCPTNVLQPAGLQHGVEALWTPVFNNRIGSSGCQLNCVTCSHSCPTAAIRPLRLDEKLGRGDFAEAGPVKMGTAFVDRSRCLPWVFGRPCLVCQENCPVSPKAIYTHVEQLPVRHGELRVSNVLGAQLEAALPEHGGDNWGTGDYDMVWSAAGQRQSARIVNQSEAVFTLADEARDLPRPTVGQVVEVMVRVQRPYVDIDRCIGCGICEHECPVSGLRAIRVTAEGETRSRHKRLGV